jgi:hypothetical protein
MKKIAPIMSDEEYDKHVYNLSEIKDRAFKKLGISLEEVMEIAPVCLKVYNYKDARFCI